MSDPYADDAERAQRIGHVVGSFMARWRGWIQRRPWLYIVYKVLLGAIGTLVIAAGIAMLVLPGPGWLTIFIGLTILGSEFHWARRLLGWLRQVLARFWERWRAWRAASKARRAEREGEDTRVVPMSNDLSSGIELSELDPAVRPQDDLFRHVNGRWIDRTEIPGDKARYGSFAVLAENAEEAVRDIITTMDQAAQGLIEGGAEREADKIAALYASFMDVRRADELGAAPIQGDIERALTVASVPELVSLVAELERQGLGGFFGMFVDNDPGDPSRYIVFVMQGGIGLPDESYYREEQFAEVREKYRAHIARMLGLAGIAEADRLAALAYDLERRIAESHWDNVASRDIQKLYNLRDFAGLQEITPQLDWSAYLAGMGAPEQAFTEVVAAQPEALAGLAALLVDEELDAWRAWLVWAIVRGSVALLSQEISLANFDFYGTALTGAPEQRERWRRGVSFVEGAVGEAVGRLYVERHFDETAKAAMDELVDHLIEAYRDSIQNLSWMSPETKQRALEKRTVGLSQA